MRCLVVSIGCVALVCALGACRPAVSAGDEAYWPRFHGPRADNISTDTGLLESWPDDGPPLAWTAEGIGEGFAGVTMARGLIYTAGNVGDEMIITALDMRGKMRWQVKNGKAYKKDRFPGARGTPTIDGNHLYHESPTGNLICLNAKTGKRIWAFNMLDAFDGKRPQWALAESVLIDGNRLICCPGGPKTAVVALDKRTHKTLWKSPSAEGDTISYASPVLAKYKGLRMILTMTAEALIGVNADGGDLLFRHPHPTEWQVNALMPVYHDGHVFISSGYGTSGSELLKLHVRGKTAHVRRVWQSKDLDNHHGGVVLLDGYIYGAAHKSGRGKWVCLDWKTGETMWVQRGVGKGPITCADGMLYTMSEKRHVGLVRANPNRYELISRFRIPRGGEGDTWAHPVVCGGRLYIRHGNFLYAYDVRK